MEKAFSYLAALLLGVGVYLQETGFFRSHVSTILQPQVGRMQTAVESKGSSASSKTVGAEIRERRRELDAVVFDTVPVSTSAIPRVSVCADKHLTVRSHYPNHSRVEAEGEVAVILSSDPEDPFHQKFMVRLDSGKLLLIVRDTALTPPVENLKLGDQVAFCGEYSLGQNGDEIRWTCKDPEGQREAGWLRHNGKIYQ